MPVTVDIRMPREARELYDPINREIGVADGRLPEGLIHHFATNTAEGFNIFEVWESQSAFERFVGNRLAPALRKVAGDQAAAIKPILGELHNQFHREA